ncbi:integral membrane protein [Xylaria cf. heliscus]|nr:integral membrane protein [Xylaria cf. heliscus]
MRGQVPRVASIVPSLSNYAASPTRLRRPLRRGAAVPGLLAITLLLLACSAIPLVSAVRIPLQNCLSADFIYTNDNIAPDKIQLQFVPLTADAVFEPDDDTYHLSVTVWGNVTGRVGDVSLPPPGDPEWDNPDSQIALNGKIQNTIETGTNVNATTLHSYVDVLNFRPYDHYAYFCESLQNASCPLGPVFNTTYILPSFNLSKYFDSSYAFTTFAPTLRIVYGDQKSTMIGCVSATVTPTLGSIAWTLKFLPLAVLILAGVAAVSAAIFSPWGTSDVFHWTSNYGRDPDLIRLVTPGFGDCLNYIQFIVLTGSLTLDYPGFYQPAVSQASWSVLIFNERFASKAGPWQSVVDGIYHTPGEYGLERIAQLNGLGEVEDIWVGTIIWLLVIIAAVLFLTQAGFLVRWLWRIINNHLEEDLRSKNIPFFVGNVIRVVFNYFLIPIVALSIFQIVIQTRVPGRLLAVAVVTLVLIIGFAVWFIYVIVTTKPRAYLSDDLPTALRYGPLYNTYKDEAAWFALVPLILNIVRGAVIGGGQPSGLAQLILLSFCELIQGILLGWVRPFHPSTWMNAYHVSLFTLRLFSLILMFPFISTSGNSEGQKGWIGYAILLIHGLVLFVAFFLNAIMTGLEVIARRNGAGGDDIRGQTRGGIVKIFNARQLKRRVDRAAGPSRLSQLSSTGMLAAAENASRRGYGRVRSESAGSMGIMMGVRRNSSAMDTHSIDAYSNLMGSSTLATTTPREASTFSFPPSPGQATRQPASTDPFYRAPRARRGTTDEAGPSSLHKAHGSLASIDLTSRRLSQAGGDVDSDIPISGRATPAPIAYAPVFAPRADYSIREADFYYNTRGPALNSDAPGRRLVTGPSDPTSPVATATGWMMRLFGGKTKDKAKGFEVVRSARMPAAMKARGGDFSDDAPPEGIPVALGVLRSGPIESDDEEDTPKRKKTKHIRGDSAGGKLLNDVSEPESDEEIGVSKISKDPPLLPDLDAGEKFQVPSRVQSKASRHPSQKTIKSLRREDPEAPEVPEVPRKSSKRNSYLATSSRLPFDRSNSQDRASTEDLSHHSASVHSSLDGSDERPASFGHVHQRSISQTEPSQSVGLLESAAEVVNDPLESIPSSSRSKQP